MPTDFYVFCIKTLVSAHLLIEKRRTGVAVPAVSAITIIVLDNRPTKIF